MPETQDQLLQVRVSGQFLAALDNWRRKKSPIPSRSSAIRELTMAGMKK